MSYVTKVYFFGAPEVTIDASAVPEPMRVYLYMMLGNLMTITVYPRIELVQYPSWITPTTFNPSSISANSWNTVEVYFDASPSQDSDFQNYGEKTVTLVWRVRFFQDSARTQLLSEALASVSVNFINPNHSSWTEVLFMPFWDGCLPYDSATAYMATGYDNTPLHPWCSLRDRNGPMLSTYRYTSPYHSLQIVGTNKTTGRSWIDLRIKQSWSKCFVMFDLYTESSLFVIRRGTTTLKDCYSPFRTALWLTYAFRVFSGNNMIYFGEATNMFIDDFRVVCK